MSIQTAFLDETTQLGLVELRPCIHAIIQASPELMTKPDQDYTVYAYDYAEFQCPLVGQGMLSRILSSDTSAIQAPTMVTGRVIENFVPFFPNAAQETVEVNLKLVSVPTPMQSDCCHPSMSNWTTLPEQAGEEGPARKRAKVTQADWRGKAPFGVHTAADSLRVAASTAASIRSHRPIAARPSQDLSSSEPPPRAPTPRPDNRSFPQYRNYAQAESSLRRGSTMSSGGFSQQGNEVFHESNMDSPLKEGFTYTEASSVGFPSSPSPFVSRNPSLALPSPGLPDQSSSYFPIDPGPLPTDSGYFATDSGYTSDPIVGFGDWSGFGGMAEELPGAAPFQHQPAQEQWGQIYNTNRGWVEVEPGPRDKLPTKVMPPRPHYREQRRREALAQARAATEMLQQAGSDSMPQDMPTVDPTTPHHFHSDPPTPTLDTPRQAPGSRSTTPGLPTSTSQLNMPDDFGVDLSVPAHHPEPDPKSQGLARSRSQTANPPEHAPSDGSRRPTRSITRPPPGSSSGARRKHQIRETYRMAVEAGEMPPYCRNCGALDTPTWRKAYTRVVLGAPKPDLLQSQDQDAKCPIVGFELNTNQETGEVISYRIYKKSITVQDQHKKLFDVLQLCNPCGLWFNAKGNMRPKDKWKNLNEPEENPRKRGRGRPAKKADAGEPQAAPDQRPTKRARASSVQPQRKAPPRTPYPAASSVANRAIQSSPIRQPLGTETSPIELDLSPNKPTSRLIFPSPRKEGEVKSLENTPSAETSGEGSLSPRATMAALLTAEINVYEPDVQDEENQPAADGDNDDLESLFEEKSSEEVTSATEASAEVPAAPKTPTAAPSAADINAKVGDVHDKENQPPAGEPSFWDGKPVEELSFNWADQWWGGSGECETFSL